MGFVLTEPTGEYFVNPSFHGWKFTDDISKATKFTSYEEAESVKEAVERAVATTYWDWSDIVPFPSIKEV